MFEYSTLAILAAFLLLYGAVAERLAKSVVSGAVVFTGFGVLLGPLGLNVLRLDVDAESLRALAELTLACVLFTDAANADLRVLKLNIGLPERLLLIGLPLTILLGIAAGYLVLRDLAFLELGILATMLAPTDAALGKAVVTNPSVPPKVRESLNVESGLNDGICVPVLFIFLALAAHKTANSGTAGLAVRLILEEIGIGGVCGLVLAVAGAAFIRFCGNREWVATTWLPVPILALAITCFATAQALGGSGFIASFVGGLTFGGLAKEHKDRLLQSAEGTGGVFSLLTWVVFGAAVVSTSIRHFSWRIVLYAILSLTVVRIVPVLVSLTGTGLRMNSKLFIGWFGPRGLASVVFIIIVLGSKLAGQETLAMTVVCTVLLSILAHGLTARPFAKAYGSDAQRTGI